MIGIADGTWKGDVSRRGGRADGKNATSWLDSGKGNVADQSHETFDVVVGRAVWNVLTV